MIATATISVIVPVRDTLYLRQSVDSLLAGSDHIDTILVYADGEVPGFASIESEYQANDKVRFIRGDVQMGPSVALNICMEQVTSDYTMFFSHDDFVTADFFDIRCELLQHGYDAITTVPVLVSHTGEAKRFEGSSFGSLKNGKPSEELVQQLFQKLNFLCMPGTIVRTTVLREFGQFSPALLGLQDYEFWLWAFIHDKKILQLRDQAVCYRFHEKNLSQQYTQRIDREYGHAIWSCLQRCSDENISRAFPEAAIWFSSATLSKDVIIALIMASHPKAPVAHFGMERLLESLNCQEQLARFEHASGMTIVDIHRGLAGFSLSHI
jgi:glycosyltransferase involved in cell wall biosynthesis